MSPILSAIVPTYNRREMLGDALRGIMSQSLRDIEIIIVDDCSSDGTQEYVKSLNDSRIKYIRREKNAGVIYNRCMGLSEARGKYAVFHDDDDYYTDYDFFRKAVNIFSENDKPPLVCVCANAAELAIETNEAALTFRGQPGRVPRADYFTLGFGRKYIKPPSLFPTVFRAETLRQAGLDKMFTDDSEIYWQAILHGDAWYIPDDVGIYRIHAESYSGGRKTDPESDARRYGIVRERAKQRAMIYEKLRGIAGDKDAREWYIKASYDLMDFYDRQGKGFAEAFRVCRIITEESSFMPDLKYILTAMWIASTPRRALRKVEFVRKIYRRLRYSGRIQYRKVDTSQNDRYNVQSSPDHYCP